MSTPGRRPALYLRRREPPADPDWPEGLPAEPPTVAAGALTEPAGETPADALGPWADLPWDEQEADRPAAEPQVLGSVGGIDLRPPAAAAAAVVFGVSAGNGFVAALALLLAAGPLTGAAVALAMAATVARWGTADLGAVAGDQAVLGAAVATGPVLAAAGSALGALALVLAARIRRGEETVGWSVVVALGVGAGALAGGPSAVGTAELAVRLAALVTGLAVAGAVAVAARRRPSLERPLSIAAVGAAAAALACSVLG